MLIKYIPEKCMSYAGSFSAKFEEFSFRYIIINSKKKKKKILDMDNDDFAASRFLLGAYGC